METQNRPATTDAAVNQRDGHSTQPPLEEKKRRFPLLAAVVAGAAIVIAGGWHFRGPGEAAAGAQGGAAPPVPVTVQTVAPQKLRLWNDFSGRLRAVGAADIRPEVSGGSRRSGFRMASPSMRATSSWSSSRVPYEAAVKPRRGSCRVGQREPGVRQAPSRLATPRCSAPV